MKFKFRLEKILSLYLMNEEKKKRELLLVNREIDRLLSLERQVQLELMEILNRRTLSEIQWSYGDERLVELNRLRSNHQERIQAVSQMKKNVTEEIQKIRSKRKAIEELREKRFKEFRLKRNKQEQKVLEDLWLHRRSTK